MTTIANEWKRREEDDAHRANELRDQGLATFEFSGVIAMVLARDERDAELILEHIFDQAESLATDARVRLSLDQSSIDVEPPESFL